MSTRILFVAPSLRHPPIGGVRLRIANTIKALSRIAEVHLYSEVSPERAGGADALAHFGEYCTSIAFSPSAKPPRSVKHLARRAVNRLARMATGRNVFTVDASPSADACRLLQRARSIDADLIWLGNGSTLYPLLHHVKAMSAYRVIVDTALVWSRFVMRRSQYANTPDERDAIVREAARIAEEECRGTKLADATIAVSDVDADYYRRLVPDCGRVHVLPNVVDLADYRTVPARPADLRRPCIYLAGTFFSPECPMADATYWFVNNVLPLLRRQIPDTRLYVVGKGSDRYLSGIRDLGATAVGQVPSVLPYLCHADVAIVPLRFESGTRFKILEAGACGVPVVSTTLGAEGLAVTSGRDIHIADEADAFANSVAAIVKDKAYGVKLGASLRSLVEEKYGVDSLVKEARLVLDYLLSAPRESNAGVR